ncbi:MAG TPA: neutral zinc metallopeptidase [Xanthobacteraceae bacterium]|jgi:predicted metalloprotease|nr:neutral zinc metallopeptidase [Xanthobacteraceae bacterium]
MRWEDLEQSSNIEDRRGEGGYVGGGGGGFPIGGGGLGFGTIAVITLVGWGVFGINPIQMLALLSGSHSSYQQTYPSPNMQQTRRTGTPTDQVGNFVSRVLGSTEVEWKDIFAKSGKTYQPPILVMYSGQTNAACGGVAQSAMGPFYCPADHRVYLDTSFFREIQTRFHGCSGSACQFSQAYVIAHEVGHHVQNLLGILPKVNAQQRTVSKTEANHLQVKIELQADCFAGIWANHENQRQQSLGHGAFFTEDDVAAALQTASAIGDDTLQRNAGRQVMPDSFTHGSSAQRQRWFTNGLQQGTVSACDTFGASSL